MDTVRDRYPSADAETVATIQDELMGVYTMICNRLDVESVMGDVSELIARLNKHYEHPENLDFDVLWGWVEITGEINLAVVDAMLPMYGAGSSQMEYFAHTYHNKFSILRERLDFLSRSTSDRLLVEKIIATKDRVVHYHSEATHRRR